MLYYSILPSSIYVPPYDLHCYDGYRYSFVSEKYYICHLKTCIVVHSHSMAQLLRWASDRVTPVEEMR